MNRPLKFRVYNIHREGWECPSILEVFDESGALQSLYEPQENFVIQQSTGLLDKNKKEIYEGDIVKTDPTHISLLFKSDESCAEYTAGQIKWLCQAFKVCQSGVGACYLGEYAMCDCCSCGLEIIGNVMENPELKQL